MHSAFDKVFLNGLTIPLRPFYRRYPFRSQASIRSADDRGMIDMELGFFCNRIPKAANSTVVTNLARLKFGRDISSPDAKKMFATPARLNRHEVDRLPSLFKFTVVRNPYTRTLSAYLDKIERRAIRDGKESSFAGFLRQAKQHPRFLYSNAHWAPQSSLMLIPINEFDLIGKVESLDSDLALIKHRLRPDMEQPVTSVTLNATGAGEKLRSYYNDELISLIQELYRDDFTTFGYSTEFPA